VYLLETCQSGLGLVQPLCAEVVLVLTVLVVLLVVQMVVLVLEVVVVLLDSGLVLVLYYSPFKMFGYKFVYFCYTSWTIHRVTCNLYLFSLAMYTTEPFLLDLLSYSILVCYLDT